MSSQTLTFLPRSTAPGHSTQQGGNGDTISSVFAESQLLILIFIVKAASCLHSSFSQSTSIWKDLTLNWAQYWWQICQHRKQSPVSVKLKGPHSSLETNKLKLHVDSSWHQRATWLTSHLTSSYPTNKLPPCSPCCHQSNRSRPGIGCQVPSPPTLYSFGDISLISATLTASHPLQHFYPLLSLLLTLILTKAALEVSFLLGFICLLRHWGVGTDIFFSEWSPANSCYWVV